MSKLAASALFVGAASCVLAYGSMAHAQATPVAPTGTPPAEAKALVDAPKKAPDAPAIEGKVDGTNVTLSAGGQLASGNSRQLAGTANGVYETRFSNNGIGASVLANYGEGAPPGTGVRTTAQNVQGRLRYDRYVIESASVFLINTFRHDRFQGIDLRYNLDPGLKYLFLKASDNALWAEVGYDLQHDIRRNDSRGVLDADGKAVIDPATTQQVQLSKTQTDHSSRLYVGFKHAFNKEVTLATGAEYLQSFVDTTRYRFNFDALFAAKVGGGLALGVGFSARYDHAPLPGKEKLDTATTLNLIYAFSDVPEPPKPPTCPCPEPPAATEPPVGTTPMPPPPGDRPALPPPPPPAGADGNLPPPPPPPPPAPGL